MYIPISAVWLVLGFLSCFGLFVVISLITSKNKDKGGKRNDE
jgi:hypothetical protein